MCHHADVRPQQEGRVVRNFPCVERFPNKNGVMQIVLISVRTCVVWRIEIMYLVSVGICLRIYSYIYRRHFDWWCDPGKPNQRLFLTDMKACQVRGCIVGKLGIKISRILCERRQIKIWKCEHPSVITPGRQWRKAYNDHFRFCGHRFWEILRCH